MSGIGEKYRLDSASKDADKDRGLRARFESVSLQPGKTFAELFTKPKAASEWCPNPLGAGGDLNSSCELLWKAHRDERFDIQLPNVDGLYARRA